MKNDYVYIGKVANTFGLKGELKVVSESSFKEYRYNVGKEIFFKQGQNYVSHKVSSVRFSGSLIMLRIDDLNDINLVERFIGSEIYALKLDMPPLEEGEYYLDDLVGKYVYDDKGTLLGIVEDVLIMPSQKTLEIKGENGVSYYPFVKDLIVEVGEKIVVKALEVSND